MSQLVGDVTRKKIKELEVMVADVRVETPDTVTLVLFTGNDRLDYKPGHFCTIDPHQFSALERFTAYLEDVKGKKEPPRAYSLSSAPHEKYVAITIKEEQYVSGKTKYPPLLSPLLVRQVPAGTRMHITGFTGPYTLPDDIEAKTDHLVHVVAGSGAVPNFSFVKHALHTGMKLKHTFICSNRTWADVCFKKELADLERAHPDKLTVVHTLTRETDDTLFDETLSGPQRVYRGRISRDILQKHIPDPSSCIVYACGPAVSVHDKAAAKAAGKAPEPRFMETVLEQLTAIGVADARIKRESYG
ncbi:MAG: oxidoreductase [Myxococcota bacterium]